MEPENAWDHLIGLAEAYHLMCRVFRNVYKWPPQVIDEIEVWKLIRIYEETKEDQKEQKDKLENEFSEME